MYRHTLFNYCNWQILCILQIESLWKPCVKQVYLHYFSNSICSLLEFSQYLPLCHILVTLTIFQTFSLLLFLLWWSVISDLWCYYYDLLKAQMMASIFSNKVFFFLAGWLAGSDQGLKPRPLAVKAQSPNHCNKVFLKLRYAPCFF